MHIGTKVNKEHLEEISLTLNYLLKDEKILGVYRTYISNEYLVITEHRLLYTRRSFSGQFKYTKEIFGDQIKEVAFENTKWSKYGELKLRTENKLKRYTSILKDEHVDIIQLATSVHGKAQPYQEIEENRIKRVKAKNKEIDEQIEKERDEWKGLIIGTVNKPSLEEAQKVCLQGERPTHIIGELGSGVLVTFQDRCVIIKKGLGTSLFASTLGGSIVTTFYYRDINSIEYNAGMLQGVLEILTPSYQGGGSNSPWAKRGAANNAFELANTLPWSKPFYEGVRHHIDWMRQKINEAKHPGVSSNSLSIGDELTKLLTLKKAGAITPEEYEALKKKLI